MQITQSNVNTEIPFDFSQKYQTVTAAESPCYSVFWNAIDFCRLYTSKKISMWALQTVLLFAGKSRFFMQNVPLKTFSRLAGLHVTWLQCAGYGQDMFTKLAVFAPQLRNRHETCMGLIIEYSV